MLVCGCPASKGGIQRAISPAGRRFRASALVSGRKNHDVYAYMCTFFLVFAFRDARFLSGLYGRFSYIVHEVGVENSRQWGQSNAVGAEARFGNGVSDVGFTASTAVSQEEAIIIAKYATRTEEMDITKHYNRRGWIWQWQYNIQAWNIPLCGGHTTIKTGAIELMPIDAGPPCCLPDYCVSENFCISCVNDAARLPGCTSTEEYLARIRRQQHAGFADQDTTPAVDPQPAELTRPRAEPTPPADPCRLRRLRRLRHTDSASGQASGVYVISEDSDCNQQPSAAVLESRSASHYPRVIKHLCVVITMALLAAGVAAGSRQGGNFRVALV
jgi:hypothetical protein